VLKGVIALYTSDYRYANAFLDYNLQNEKEKITVKVYTNDESFEGAVAKEAFDLLLVDSMCMDERIAVMPCKKAVLSRNKFITKQNYPAIFMYQKAMLVFKQIYEILSEDTVEERICCAAMSAMPKFIGVFSPCYPVLRERFARSLAAHMAETKKVLFLNMAKFAEYDEGEEKGLSELLLFIQEEGKSILYKLNAMVSRVRGYDSLAGVHHYKDIDDIRIEDINRLIKQFELIDEYDVVVMDVGLSGEVANCLLSYCRSIWMPVNKDISYGRHRHMKSDIAKEKQNELWENIKEINLSSEWCESEDVRSIWMKEHIDITA